MKKIVCIIFISIAILNCACSSNDKHIKSITAISEVFGDGQKVSAVAIEYDADIDNNSLSTTDYTIEGKTITRVYTNDKAEKSTTSVQGKYVIVEVLAEMATPVFPAETKETMAGPGVGTPREMGNNKSKTAIVTNAVITQSEPVSTVDGKVYGPVAEPMQSTKEVCLIVDDFKQFEYYDKNTDITLKYNLYIPKDYDPSKSYPLVLFIHDASGAGKDIKNTLTQGLGAVIWASPEEQAKHECFVLAPQYNVVTVDDNFNTTSDLDVTLLLLKDIQNQYSVDKNRIYTTGQSMGCMSSIVLMLREPDLFAAAMLVAGQWNPEIMGPLAKKDLWILVSQGDKKASGGMDAAVEIWKKAGGKISEAYWDPKATKAEQAENVAKMEAENSNIKYTKFYGGSHNYTWWIAYSIEGVRDWLFSQSK